MGTGGSKQHRHIKELGERPSPPGKPILIPGTPRTDPDVISIRWDPPFYTGGSKITGYLVEHRRTGSPHWVRATPLLVRGTTLTLSGLEPGMRYQFRVTAENQHGRSEPGLLSEAFAVSYQRHVSLAPSFIRSLSDATAIENEKVEFSVVAEGMPTPKITWYKDGVEIFSTRRQRIVVDGEKSSFIIHQAALQDEGEIKCTATNIAGHVVTKAQLTLEAGAGLRLPRQYEEGLLFELGEAVRLRVGVTGKPEPTVTWYHNSKEIQPGGRIELTRKDKYACLRITEASRVDRGEYRITASNKLGSDSASILVTITDRPLSPGKAQVVMTLGRCVTLAWTPPEDDGGCKIGNYIVEYYRIGWNMWLKAATCRQLTTTLGDLIEGSEYKFRVKAENPYGVSDPSSESDVVFIPDPKRGLLEAPVKGENTEEMIDSAEWLEAKRKHKELDSAKSPSDQDWQDIPSQVSLANQVLRKVKMAPKRGWSEDSQGSPPTTPERQLCPVPPKRKIRDKRKAQSIIEEVPPIDYDDVEVDIPSKSRLAIKQDSSDLRRYSNPDNVYSSSEMMFLILPGEEQQQKKKEEVEREDEEMEEEYDKDESSFTLPPLSFSCPELGSCDPYEIEPLRLSVSSSELLHDRTLARMNKEIADEEAEEVAKTKYGLERKRSFERRHKRELYVARSSYKKKLEDFDIYDIPETNESKTNMSDSEEAQHHYEIVRRSSKDKFMQSDSSFEEFSTRFEEYEGDSEYEEDYDYEEGDDEYEESSDIEIKYDFERSRISRYVKDDAYIEEDTFHRNMTMLPLPMSNTISLSKESSPQGSDRSIPIITLNEKILEESPPVKRKDSVDNYLEELRRSAERELRKSAEKEIRKSPEKVDQTQQRPIVRNKQETVIKKSPDKDMKIIIPQTSNNEFPITPSPTSIVPKPILKMNKDDISIKKTEKKSKNLINRISMKKPEEKPTYIPSVSSTSSETRNKKKVRIEEPFDNDYFHGETNIVMTGEVAKNRRMMNKQKRDSNDPANVVISHYSELVKEYGKVHQKPKTQIHLSFDELKAAAEKANSANIDLNQSANETIIKTNISTTSAKNESNSKPEEVKMYEEEKEEVQINKTSIDITAPTKFQHITEFILDLCLFCIAFYLYLFRDPRLAIPVLVLMIYRKLCDTISKKISPKVNKIVKYFKKEKIESEKPD